MSLTNTTTSITVVAAPVTTTLYTTEITMPSKDGEKSIKEKFGEWKEKVKAKLSGDREINVKISAKKMGHTLTTTATTATTVGVSGKMSDSAMQKIQNKTLTAYVESMSDEELETALQNFNLLDRDNNIKTNIK